MTSRRPQLQVGGTCVNGHEIRSDADLKFFLQKYPGKESKLRVRCRACQSRKKEVSRKYTLPDKPTETRRVFMTCGHYLYFQPQWPKVNDLILCQLCSEYRVVTNLRRE